jgi:hypothetical protein
MNDEFVAAPVRGQQTSSPQRQLWENPENEIDSSPVYGAKDSRPSHHSLIQSRYNPPLEIEIPMSHTFTNLLTHIIFSTKDRTHYHP